ncbi:hypothetical protein B566_EDAN012757 [Ephemera danica]|nr:hypothetical protein B566_EDAN012757 [Ephemera danica]
MHLEFAYLTDVTGDPKYRTKVERIREFLNKKEKPNGLYPILLDPTTGNWGPPHITLGAFGDSFYEYLLKSWLQSGQNDSSAHQMFETAMEAVITHLVRHSRGGLTFIAEMKNNILDNKMEDITCFAGGMFALAARDSIMANNMNLAMKYREIAEGLTTTCHEVYSRTKTGLGPKVFRFTDTLEAQSAGNDDKKFILRPEVVESYFYMWRLTKGQMYRDWGWEVLLVSNDDCFLLEDLITRKISQALEKYCRTDSGYSGIKNVYEDPPEKDDIQQSFFLAETLKYLYLLFSDDNVVPLDQWVFNTEAHPLPIKDANSMYRLAYRQ